MYFNNGTIASIVTILFAVLFAALMRRGNKMADGQQMAEITMENIIEIVKFWIKLGRLNARRFKFEQRLLELVAAVCSAITVGCAAQMPLKFSLIPATLSAFCLGAIKILKRGACYYSAHKTMWALQLEFDDFRLETGKYSCTHTDAVKMALAQGDRYSHSAYKLGVLREAFSLIQRTDMAQWETIARPSGDTATATSATPPTK